jgi:hypothetical protein
MHDISDGFVLVGINSQVSPVLSPLAVGEGGIAETESSLGAKVAINPTTHKVTVANATQNLATTLALLMTTLTSLNAALAAMTTGSIAAGSTQSTIAALSAVLTTVTTDLAALLY